MEDLTLLVIEPDDSMRFHYRNLLRGANVKTDFVCSPHEALYRLMSWHFDGVIGDLNAGEQHDWQMLIGKCRQLKTPFIFNCGEDSVLSWQEAELKFIGDDVLFHYENERGPNPIGPPLIYND